MANLDFTFYIFFFVIGLILTMLGYGMRNKLFLLCSTSYGILSLAFMLGYSGLVLPDGDTMTNINLILIPYMFLCFLVPIILLIKRRF